MEPVSVLPVNYEEYSVVEFKLHKYPMANKNAQLEFSSMSDSEIIKDTLVSEMYYAFSGYFKL